jgi:hypothetical protein
MTMNLIGKVLLGRGINLWGGGGGGGGGWGCQNKKFPSSKHVSQRVPNSTSILSHMLCQMLPSFHLYNWAKVRNIILQNKTIVLEF